MQVVQGEGWRRAGEVGVCVRRGRLLGVREFGGVLGKEERGRRSILFGVE